MSDETKLVALPAYLPRRLQAFRIVSSDKTSYVLRDKLAGKTYDVEQWQFFVLEVLPGCDDIHKLLSVFSDRFGREISEREVMLFFAWLADHKLLDEESAAHPLLKPFTRQGYALEQGLVKPKSFEELAAKMAADAAPALGAGAAVAQAMGGPAGKAILAAGAKGDEEPLPAGVNDADNLDPKQSKQLFRLFAMQPVVSRMLPIVEPLKYGVYVLPLLAIAALMLMIQYSSLAFEDLTQLRSATNLLEHAAFSLLTINLAVTFTQALIAQKFRASVGDLGIGLRFSFFPRFTVNIKNTEQLSRRERMWLQGGPLLMRVLLFSLGALIWYNTRDSHPTLSTGGLGMTFLCAVNLVIEGGNPLVKGNGYHLLAAFMDEPYLRGKSYKAFMDRWRGGASTEANSLLLSNYALASFVYAYFVVLVIALVVSHFLIIEMHVGGAGIIIAVALGIYLTVRTIDRFKMIGQAYDRSVQFDRWRKRALPAEGGETVQREPTGSRTTAYVQRALLLTLLLLLFLPYPYEAGGTFEIFPSDRQLITTDISSIVEEVNFDGGESVKKGAVIARIAATDLNAQMAVVDARIAEQKATIADLKARPKPEEVVVVERELEVTQKRAQYSGERVPRLSQLYLDKTISLEELEAARKDADVDVREVAQREAALVLVKVGTTPDKIAAEVAKLDALKQQRAEIVGKVMRTTMRMPFDGNILTLHLKQKVNSVLDKGLMCAVVESTGSVTAEIEVPESEIAYVKLGAVVRSRPNAYYEQVFEGKVQTIDRNVTNKSFGKVVKVIAVMDNSKDELKTGMTGYSKIRGGSIPVWKAFSQALIRFFNVQVWSWVP